MVDLIEVPVFCGLRGCALGVLRAELLGGERTGDFWGVLAAVDARGVGALTGVVVGFRAGRDLALATGGLEGGDGSTSGSGGGRTGSTATGSAIVGGEAALVGGDVGCGNVGSGNVVDAAGDIVEVSSLAVDLGGHSLFSFTSSLAESPVIWDTTLLLRGS